MNIDTESLPLSPSLLPMLARCGQFQPDTMSTLAAGRVGRLKETFRALVARENVSVEALEPEDRVAARWAEQSVRALSGGLPLDLAEEARTVRALGLEATVDALCPEGGWSADLQPGLKHGRAEEQALHALGLMERLGTEEWTVYLLYADLHEVETLRFTREEAEGIVRSVLARTARTEPPVENEYCPGCARRWECVARREALGVVPLAGLHVRKVRDWPSELLREFVLRASTVAEFALEARAVLKERCLEGERVPGVALSAKRGPRRVNASALAPLVASLGPERVLEVCGSISEVRALDLWREAQLPFPTAAVQELPGSAFVRVGAAGGRGVGRE